MHRLRRSSLWASLLLIWGGLATASEIRSYRDADGTVVYTNVGGPSTRSETAERKRSGGTLGKTMVSTSMRVASARAPTARKGIDRRRLATLVSDAAARYNIPEPLIWAVIQTESAFNPRAVSPKGAQGLMQLMPATAEALGVEDAFDPEQNIDGGVRYLRQMANSFDGDMVQMLAAYNAGPHKVRRHGGKVPPYRETRAYVRKVVSLYYEYKERLGEARVAR